MIIGGMLDHISVYKWESTKKTFGQGNEYTCGANWNVRVLSNLKNHLEIGGFFIYSKSNSVIGSVWSISYGSI